MDDLKLQQLRSVFGSEKKFMSNGYYRIRTISDEEVEIAFLEADACGATTACPQITLKKVENQWCPIKYINMGVSPTQSFTLNHENNSFLNQELDKLVRKFEEQID